MNEADYIVVGSGAAGSVVAARLSENPAVQVLLLESGRRRHSPMLSVPAAEVLFTGTPRYDWRFRTEPDPTAGDRQFAIPRGRLLGGSNAINGMIFVRGQREDYDSWASAGNPGWGWDDVLQHFCRLENAIDFPGPTRGTRGPITVTAPGEADALCEAFLTAADARGYPRNPDYNDGEQEGFGFYQAAVRRGVRSSVLGGYLAPARRRPNVTIVTDAHVTRLDFDGTTCTGVEYVHEGASVRATARREVVVSGGAVQSPQLLELSGVGSPDVLAAAGIPLRHALPGVGENLRDHFAVRTKFEVRRPITLNDRTRGWRLAREAVRWVASGRGALASPIAVLFGFLRSTPNEPRPDLQIHMTPGSYGPSATRRFDRSPGMTVGVYPLQPESRGSVHVTTADPHRPPAVRPRFLDADADRRRLVDGVRRVRELLGESALGGLRGEELAPAEHVATDDELLDYARAHGDTSYHPVGTCRMGVDAQAVVDERLRVRGLERLRVIDASIMPTMVSGNTNAASLMIGEKGAAMIVEDRVGPRELKGLLAER